MEKESNNKPISAMKAIHILTAALALTAAQAATAQTMDIQRHGDTTIVTVNNPT